MISENLYPVDGNFQGYFTGGEINYPLEYSTTINRNNYSDKLAGYYIGWIKPENIPEPMRFSKVHVVNYPNNVSDDALKLHINALGMPEINVDVGFGMLNATADNRIEIQPTYTSFATSGNADGTYTPFGSGSNYSIGIATGRGINNIYPELQGVYSGNFYFSVYYMSPAPDSTFLSKGYFTNSITYSSYISFKNNVVSFTYNNGTYGNISLTYSDFDSNGKAEVSTSIGNHAVVVFMGFVFNNAYTHASNGAYNPILRIAPILHQKCKTKFGDSVLSTSDEQIRLFYFVGTYDNSEPFSVDTYWGYSQGSSYPIGVTHDLLMTVGDFKAIPNYSIATQYDGYIIRKSGTQLYFLPYYPFTSFEKYLGLLPMTIVSTSVESYGGVNLAPYVTPANEFTGRTHTGRTNDAGFIASLREWQYIDPVDSNPQTNGTQNTNEYDYEDPDDKPEYNPPSPTPEGDIGVNPDNPEANMAGAGDAPEDNVYSPIVGRPLPKAANKFITTYVLTQTQVETVGDVMWADTLESIKNGAAVYGDTGTFNLARLYDLIVSLRFYPFEIPTGYTTSVNGLTMGTGHTVFVEGAIPALDSLAMTVECGTCTIPAMFNSLFPDMKNGDFRNYVNSTITVYLPFCGIVELNPSDVVGYTIALKYHIDLLSGGCTASITLNRENSSFMIANKSGSIGVLMPITATNAGQVTANILSDTANVVSTIGSTVMSVLAAKGTMGDINTMRSDPDLSANRSIQLDAQERNTKLGMANKSVGVITDAMHGAGNLLSRAGCAYSAMGGGYGSSAYTMTISPFVTIRTSKYASPNNYNHSTGFNSTDYKAIGEFKGFSVFVNPDLTGVDGTAAELSELKAILEHGIFIKK